MDKRLLTLKETVARGAAEGMPISEYTLRRAVKSGQLPCRVIGKKYLIVWDIFVKWLMCEDWQPPEEKVQVQHGIRRLEP